MSAIPIKLTQDQFERHIRPYLSTARRGYKSRIPLFKIFNSILHFRKWSRDGSLEGVWQSSILEVQDDLNLSELNLDGSHTSAKKGGESVAYQGGKKAKTSHIFPVSEANGYIITSTGIVAGNHHDAFNLKAHLQDAFWMLKQLGLDFKGSFFNADSAFDSKEARKLCFDHGAP